MKRQRAIKSVFILMLIAFILSGCVMTDNYVRSEFFADSAKIHRVFVLPIVYQVSLDSEFDISAQGLKERTGKNREMLAHLIRSELEKRGYGVTLSSKDYNDLNSQDSQDAAIKKIVSSLLKNYDEDRISPSLKFSWQSSKERTQPVPEEKSLSRFVPGFLKNAFPFKKRQADGVSSKGLLTLKQEGPDAAFAKQRSFRGSQIPQEADTVMFVYVDSYVSKRGWFGLLNEKSVLKMRSQLISVESNESIFVYEDQRPRADLLNARSVRKTVNTFIAKIPVRL